MRKDKKGSKSGAGGEIPRNPVWGKPSEPPRAAKPAKDKRPEPASAKERRPEPRSTSRSTPRPKPAPRPRTKRPASDRPRLGPIPIAALTAVILLSVVGWMWKSQLRVRDVVVEGARHTPTDTVLALARIDTALAFFDIDTIGIAERLARLPWVESATVRRAPNITIEIQLAERTPALLVIDDAGRPSRYLDRNGYPMPYTRGGYDVPLLRGYDEPFVAGKPTEHPALLELVEVLADTDPATDALLSEFELGADGLMQLYTTPKPGRGAVHVGLGTGDFERKLSRLQAFWDQEVLAQREKHYEWIDLRFDSQIITRERTLTQ